MKITPQHHNLEVYAATEGRREVSCDSPQRRSSLKRAVELGAGIGIVSREVVRTELAAGTLHALAIRERGFVHPIDLIYHRDRAGSPLIAAVLEVARKVVSSRA